MSNASTKQGYERILVATDFSQYADAAFRQAVWIARRTGARITLMHSLPNLRDAIYALCSKSQIDLIYGDEDQFQREIRRESDTKMRQAIANLNASDLDVKIETLFGEAFVAITHAVQQEGYDLVLVGTRGLGAWKQFLVGSTAKRLIRKCPAAVWIVKAEHVGPPKIVLAPTDLSGVSLKAVRQGLWVAGQADAQLHVLQVIDSIEKIPHGSSLWQEINTEAEQRLEAFVKSLDLDPSSLEPGCSRIHTHVSWGNPWEEIGRTARDLNVGLIAMGTVGRSGIKGVLIGNMAEKVLGTCDCSILTVKPDGFVSPIEPAFWPLHPGTVDPAAAEQRPEA